MSVSEQWIYRKSNSPVGLFYRTTNIYYYQIFKNLFYIFCQMLVIRNKYPAPLAVA